MGRLIAVWTACALLGASGRVLCDDHLVTRATAEARLSQAATQQEQDVRAVEHVLSRPEAAAMAAALGTTVGRVQTAVPTLSPAELHNLAARATLLTHDPVAGEEGFPVHDFLIVFLIVAIVVLVLGAV